MQSQDAPSIFVIPPSNRDGFKGLLEISKGQFDSLLQKLNQSNSTSTLFGLEEELDIGNIPFDIDDIMIAIKDLLFLKEESSLSEQDFGNEFYKAIKDDGKILTSANTNKEDIVYRIIQIIQCEPALVLFKSRSLAVQEHKELSHMRIITDIRPVFSSDANSLSAFVEIHRMNISFMDGDTERTESISVNNSDLRDIIQQAERALTKSDTLEDNISTSKVRYFKSF